MGVDSLKIFLLEESLNSCDSIEKGTRLIIDGRWLDSLYMLLISLLGLEKGL